MSLLTRKQQWRRCRHKRRAESCDVSLYDDLLKALHPPTDGQQLHKVASAPELYTLSRPAAAEERKRIPFGVSNSFSETDVVELHKRTKQVRFASVVNVVLIPTRQEFEAVKLNHELWWSDDDYSQFKASAMEEYIRRMQKRMYEDQQQQQQQVEQQQAAAAADAQQCAAVSTKLDQEEQVPDCNQGRSMKHVDSIVLTQCPQATAVQTQDDGMPLDDLLLSDIHHDGSTEASSVDEQDDETVEHCSSVGSPEADGQQKRFCRSDSDSSPIEHLDSLELRRQSAASSPTSSESSYVSDCVSLGTSDASQSGSSFQELEDFLRQHAAYCEWRSVSNNHHAVMI